MTTLRGTTIHLELQLLVALVAGGLTTSAAAQPLPPKTGSPKSASIDGAPVGCSVDRVPLRVGTEVQAPVGGDLLALYDTTEKRRLKDLQVKDGKWTVRDEDLHFDTPRLDISNIQLAWFKKTLESPSCLQPFLVVPNPVVTNVYCDQFPAPCRKGLGDQITIEVEDLESWLRDHRTSENMTIQEGIAKLVPFFDGQPLRGLHAENPGGKAEDLRYNFHAYHHLIFTLERNEANKEVWNRLLKVSAWNGRRLDVSVGIDGGDSLYSWVQKAEPSSRDPNPSLYQRFTLVVVPHGPAIAAAALFVAALVFFLCLVKWTTILQDVSAPVRPDGKPPYSLARMQMAFWFFLVVTAWFLLFLVTRDMDTLTSSVLILMGISAGTAVGSAIMDAGATLDAADRIAGIPATTDRQGLAKQVGSLRESLAKSRIRPTTNDQEEEAKHA